MKNKLLAFLLLFSMAPLSTWATHLRAGEITAKRISATSLTYRVTLTTYTDEINGKSANEAQESVSFFFGLRSSNNIAYEVQRDSKILISSTTVQNVYDTVFTYPAPGLYTITCAIPNRNEGTINLGPDSDNLTFFVQSSIFINASVGLNSTPVLLNIPVDSAAVGARFIHNPGAFDLDGDSLAYRLDIPRQQRQEGDGTGVYIPTYEDPTAIGPEPRLNENEDGPATFRIDARTGDLIWDAPKVAGQYNVAFVVEEWRKSPNGSFVRIGEIVRDMQIIVVDTENNRPEVSIPPDICVEAGENIEFEVLGEDEDGQKILLTTSGGVYNLNAAGDFERFIADDAASFEVLSTASDSPVSGTFSWQTNCSHVREQAYGVLFKVEDVPERSMDPLDRFNVQLTDIKTLKINVNPPRPIGLLAEAVEERVKLTWNAYPDCLLDGVIEIYRKDGCSGLNPAQCSMGIPASWNYRKIGEVALGDTVFHDENATPGVIYSYRLVSEIDVTTFTSMKSAPSTEFCIGSEVPESTPVITKVSVKETSTTNGKVELTWTRPLGFTTNLAPGPYAYELSRTQGLGGENFEVVARIPTSLDAAAADTVFLDTGLNTEGVVYKYKVAFYTEGDNLLGEAPAASTVRLNARPDDESVSLFWEANVPWNNDNQIHRIYREDRANPGSYNLIAVQNVSTVNTYDYIDNGADNQLEDGDISVRIENNQEFCYLVETTGEYDQLDPSLGLTNLRNLSQEICATPADRSPPCPPVLSLENNGCEGLSQEDFCNVSNFTNQLSWINPNSIDGRPCREDLVRYNVYFSRFEGGSFEQIALTEPGNATNYDHLKNSKEGFAGCYQVTSVSSLGIESPPSNTVCADNCELISFPNVFSPNGDGTNDTFEPMPCPAFVKEISYQIFDRQGLLIAEGSGDELSWDGRVTDGDIAAPGTYFYSIDVSFERLSENSQTTNFKGWLEIIK